MNGYYQPQDDRKDPSTPRSGHRSSLGQLRQNLRDARLREATHLPHYPSPLSQSPMQASISSASRTAASMASSSRSTVSTSTTPPSTSSRFSINQAFKELTDKDIEFFDRIISELPSHAADFSQLKSAYTAHLPGELDRRYRSAGTSQQAAQVDWDAHLWSTLLSLVKVRGKNWRERWDSVRLAFGLDPNSGDETDLSGATQSTSKSASGSSTQHGVDLTSDPEWDESLQHDVPGGRGSASPGHSYPARAIRRDPILPSRYSLGLPRSSSPPPKHPYIREEMSTFRTLHDELAQTDESQPARLYADDPISEIQSRLRRMMVQDEHTVQRDARNAPPLSSHLNSFNHDSDSSRNATRLPMDAKRRFDELVRSSQSARATLRQSKAVSQGREEQEALIEQLEVADLWRGRRLLQTCLAWWITLTRQQLEKSQNAADAGVRVLVEKAWERWRTEAHQALQGRRIGEKTDRVRCALTALRTWKRVAHTAVERREELKKDSMRAAYYTTTTAVKTRISKTAFQRWKQRHMHHFADTIRRRHLQGGAFALWQMRSSHTKQLQIRERVLEIKRDRTILSQAYERWSDRSDKAQAVSQFQDHNNRLLLLGKLHAWRERALLASLSRAFAERRLKLAAIDGWKEALKQRHVHHKQEAIASRWRTRRLKYSAVVVWRRQRHKLEDLQNRATEMHSQIQRDKMVSLFHRWQLRSRAALLERVRKAGTLERTFAAWKHSYTALTTSLNQRESTIVDRRNQRVSTACFQRWRQLATTFNDREAQVQAQRNETLRNDFFITWRNKQLQHRLLRQKSEAVSDYFTLRSTLHRWRSRLRDHRADVKEASHNRRLVEQVFEIWRSKAAKQQRLAMLLRRSLAQSDEKLARAYLNQWVAKIIEVRNRELEVQEQRQRRLIKAAFYAWIEACLRHDDLLALMNSYIDVKEEERKRQTFLHWLNFARESKARRENLQMLEASARQKSLASTWNAWRDKLTERALAAQEYEMLMQRQQLLQQWALDVWKTKTLLLPAIRLRNTSLRRHAFQQWRQNLPGAQMSNQATKVVRARLLQASWQAWKDKVKVKRQFRAAARFGAGTISTQRLRSLASAANRSNGSSSPSAAHSSSPFRGLLPASSPSHSVTPLPRPKTSLDLRTPTPADRGHQTPRTGRSGQREPSFSRRGTSVPRHLEASFTTESAELSPARSNGTATVHDAVSPSKEALSRRAKAAVAAGAAHTSTSVSEQSRFSLGLSSSTSSITAMRAPLDGLHAANKSRRRSHVANRGPTLSSAAQRSTLNQREPSDTESDFARRVKRSAKYETPLGTDAATSQEVGSRPPASNDGFESGNSVHSAPARSALVDRSSTPRQSLAVAEDMISQLRARAASRQHRHG